MLNPTFFLQRPVTSRSFFRVFRPSNPLCYCATRPTSTTSPQIRLPDCCFVWFILTVTCPAFCIQGSRACCCAVPESGDFHMVFREVVLNDCACAPWNRPKWQCIRVLVRLAGLVDFFLDLGPRAYAHSGLLPRSIRQVQPFRGGFGKLPSHPW